MIGNRNRISSGSNNNFILGNNVSIGAGIQNSVALGNDSTVSSSNEVSVGSATLKRKITNVADGEVSALLLMLLMVNNYIRLCKVLMKI